MSSRATSTDYRHPYRPIPIRVINRIGFRADLSPEALMSAARRRCGLHDFGDGALVEPLEVLVDSIEREGHLSTAGRTITRERLVGVLGNRLRAHVLFSAHPEILERTDGPMIVITGLQRTGTTALHRMLGAHPGARIVASWEVLNPAPLGPGRGSDGKRRRRLAKLSEWALGYIASDFFAVHPVQAEAPEEESILLDFSMLSPVSEAILRVPSYSRWLGAQDVTPSYEYLKKLLKLLMWQRAGDHWVLKTPHHLGYLDVLLDVFPTARVVQMHRDPARTIASFCSMVAHGRGVFSDRIDPVEIGQEWLDKQVCMVERAMDVRAGRNDGRVLDVHYHHLLEDPRGLIERVCDFAGIDLGPAEKEAIRVAQAQNRQHRHGIHRYRMEDFGLDLGLVRKRFARYCACYRVMEEA